MRARLTSKVPRGELRQRRQNEMTQTGTHLEFSELLYHLWPLPRVISFLSSVVSAIRLLGDSDFCMLVWLMNFAYRTRVKAVRRSET